MPSAWFGGSLTHWREWGRGDRHALMFHCSLAHSGAWAGVAERLTDVLHLSAFDLPSHGQSGDWDATRDYTDQTVEMALGLMRGPTDLIGHSFGAVACLRLVLERPDLVRSLFLYEPVLFAAARARGFDTRALFADFAAALGMGDRAAAARHFIALWGGGERWDDISDRQREALVRRIHIVPAGSPTLEDDRSQLLAPGRLEACRVPVLLLEGSASPAVVPAINAALFERLPNVRRMTIAGADHMGPVTHPAEVAAAIRSAL